MLATAVARADALIWAAVTELFTYSYTAPWNPTERVETDPLGKTTTLTYRRDPDSNIPLMTSTTGECASCGSGPNTQNEYHDSANPLRITRTVDARGTVTLLEYDANGRLQSRTEAMGTELERTTSWEYDAAFPSLVTATERPSTSGSGQRRSSTIYDEAGNATTRTEEGLENGSAFSYSTITTYSGEGQPLTIDPPGYGTADQTVFTYAATRGNQLVETCTDPLVGTTSFAYDAFNRRSAVTDPNGVTTETLYDGLDRVTRIVQQGGVPSEDLVTTQVYNVFGDLFRTILPQGNIIEYGYDSAGRLISIERRPGATTHGERTFYTLNGYGHRIRREQQRWDGSGWMTESFTRYVYPQR